MYVYLRKCLPRTYFGEYVVLISYCCYQRAPTGRYSCIAQAASPGLINGTHLLSPFRAALPYPKQMLAPKVPLLIGAHIICCLCLPRVPFRALPSFHPGLCRNIVPMALIMRLDFDVLVLHKSLKLRKKYLPLICLIKGDHCIVRHSLKVYPL